MAQIVYFASKNQRASRLRQLKYRLVRRFSLPEDMLGGCLAVTHRRCGKPTCHCSDGPGHPMWTLSYSLAGKKRVEVMPEALASELAPLVEQGRKLREAVMEVLAINLQLLRLWRLEQRRRQTARPKRRAGAARAKHKSPR
jgi:hypothetical protein